jgi:hypothetical protein
MRFLLFTWEFASASSESERTPRPKTIRGARFTAAGRAAQIAALQHFNNAWTPRAGSAALPAKYAIPAATRAASTEEVARALSILSALRVSSPTTTKRYEAAPAA